MKDSNMIRGVVSARDSKTGKVFFENLHNTVVVGGCLFSLAKLIGVTDHTEIYNGDIVEGFLDGTTISHYNFVSSPNPAPNPEKVDKTEEAGDGWLFPSPLPLVDAEKDRTGFFNGNESYKVADIPEDAGAAKILYLPRDGANLTFIRFKLPLTNGEISPSDPSIVTYVKSIGLFIKKNDNLLLFSKLNFPAIPFFGNLSVDFEYRLYL